LLDGVPVASGFVRIGVGRDIEIDWNASVRCQEHLLLVRRAAGAPGCAVSPCLLTSRGAGRGLWAASQRIFRLFPRRIPLSVDHDRNQGDQAQTDAHPLGHFPRRHQRQRPTGTQPPTPAHAAAPPTRPISAGRIQVLMRRHARAIISARNTAMLEAVADRRLPGRRIAGPRTGPLHREASDRVSNGCSTRLAAREGRWGRSCLVGTTAHSAHQSASLVSASVSSSGLRRRFRRRSPRTAWVAGRALVVLRPRPRRPSRRGWP
jgi:hypothetical protein